jgi:hypothetical protein
MFCATCRVPTAISATRLATSRDAWLAPAVFPEISVEALLCSDMARTISIDKAWTCCTDSAMFPIRSPVPRTWMRTDSTSF